MSRIRTIVEATWIDDTERRDHYYLLHWGNKFDLMPDGEGRMVPVFYTIAICQQIKTGQIETFLPEQLKVLGITTSEGEYAT